MSTSKTLDDVGKTYVVKNQKLFHMSSDDFLSDHSKEKTFADVNEQVYQMSVLAMLNKCDDYGIKNNLTSFEIDELCDELTRHILEGEEEQDE